MEVLTAENDYLFSIVVHACHSGELALSRVSAVRKPLSRLPELVELEYIMEETSLLFRRR